MIRHTDAGIVNSVLLHATFQENEVQAVLTESLRRLDAREFTHFIPIQGSLRSGRLFTTSEYDETVPLPKGMDARDLTEELKRMRNHGARYEDPWFLDRSWKGWEIRLAYLPGARTGIVVWFVHLWR